MRIKTSFMILALTFAASAQARQLDGPEQCNRDRSPSAIFHSVEETLRKTAIKGDPVDSERLGEAAEELYHSNQPNPELAKRLMQALSELTVPPEFETDDAKLHTPANDVLVKRRINIHYKDRRDAILSLVQLMEKYPNEAQSFMPGLERIAKYDWATHSRAIALAAYAGLYGNRTNVQQLAKYVAEHDGEIVFDGSYISDVMYLSYKFPKGLSYRFAHARDAKTGEFLYREETTFWERPRDEPKPVLREREIVGRERGGLEYVNGVTLRMSADLKKFARQIVDFANTPTPYEPGVQTHALLVAALKGHNLSAAYDDVRWDGSDFFYDKDFNHVSCTDVGVNLGAAVAKPSTTGIDEKEMSDPAVTKQEKGK